MKGKRRTANIVILAVIACLAVVFGLCGCEGVDRERFSGIVKSLNPAPTATALSPTALPATAEPSPTMLPPTPIPPSPTAGGSPTRAPTHAPTPTPSRTPTPALEAMVAVDALTLRAGPGTVYARLATLRQGDPLTIIARTDAGDWLAVTIKGGKGGWVAAAYVELNVPLEEIPLATELPPTPVPRPTQTPAPLPTQTLPAESQPTPLPSETAPTSGPLVDEQIAEISAGRHGQLPQPPVIGSVQAGGEAELTILNDTPYALTVLIGSPNQTTITVEKCLTCTTYGFVGPQFCQEDGRPRQTVRVKPGTMQVAALVDNPSVIPFSGEWTLVPDNAYFDCFFIVSR
jgi:hypothetical protein